MIKATRCKIFATSCYYAANSVFLILISIYAPYAMNYTQVYNVAHVYSRVHNYIIIRCAIRIIIQLLINIYNIFAYIIF
jgi:hypothetical protein